MNELERMIAALGRPQASLDLDERIAAIPRGPNLGSRPARGIQGARGTAWLLSGVSLGVGLFGFLCGRWSSRQSPPTPPTTATAAALPQEVTRVPIPEGELAGLFAAPPVREGLLGFGPFHVDLPPSR